MSAAPFRIFAFTSEESTPSRCGNWPPLIQVPLCIFHFPTKNSKSLGEELAKRSLQLAVSVDSTFGMGMLLSAVSSLFCAGDEMGKRQDQNDDQAISRNESASHRSTKAKTGR